MWYQIKRLGAFKDKWLQELSPVGWVIYPQNSYCFETYQAAKLIYDRMTSYGYHLEIYKIEQTKMEIV